MQTEDIKVANISAELAKMQDNACLFNLVIYSQSVHRTAYLKEVVQSIVEKFPCRIIFIQGNPESEEHFFHASVVKGINNCPQINIEASCNELHRVPYVVIPNLVTDLPLYLLWGYDPTEEKIVLPQLKPFATRLIFDAESCATRLKNFSEKILKQLNTFKVDIMDLNWAWISNWRDVLTQTFATQEKIHDLEAAHTIVIEYNEGKNCTLTQAIYLQGWLAAQLNWTFTSLDKSQSNIIVKYSSKKGEHTIAICPKTALDIPPGSILSVEVTTENNRNYYISKKKGAPLVVVHISSQLTCDLPFTLALANPRRGLGFLREIFYQHTSEHYQKMLKTIEAISWDRENEKN